MAGSARRGRAGILTEQGGGWFYKRNRSPASDQPVELGPIEQVPTKPNVALLAGEAQFMDLGSDGHLDLVMLEGPTPGAFAHDEDEGWEPFRPFTSHINRSTRDPNLRFIDLDGDGLMDVLLTEDDALVWHPSLGSDGFGPARMVPTSFDEEKGPRRILTDETQAIFLADMKGDGLTDLVRVRNGEICYWPNLGYGHFGAKITMDRAPLLDGQDQFDHRRVILADIDGTGTADLIYLHREGVRLHFNQSGNRWSPPRSLTSFPSVDKEVRVSAIDLLGNGTICLVWSSPLPNDSGHQMRFVDLMGGGKPHLLITLRNNLGAETRVQYAPSTKFYVQDREAGTPWITRLPFPVQVVERLETIDAVSGNRFVTRSSFHHGFYDGFEREFRGFGRVEQTDTEEFAALTGDGTLPPATNEDSATHVPPVLTKTWFHTGIYLGREHVSNFFAGLLDARDTGEYREPGLTDAQASALLLPDTILPPGLTFDEEREACRSLKGLMLRQEIYALDASANQDTPYTVAEQNFTIERVQPEAGNRHPVFFTHSREAVRTHYERNPVDPRITHELTLQVDGFGNVLKSLNVAYGRRAPSTDPVLTAADRAKQSQLLITHAQNLFTNAVTLPQDYRVPALADTHTLELTGFAPEGGAARFSFDEWTRDDFALLDSAVEIPYEQAADGINKQERVIERVQTRYRSDSLAALLALGSLESHGLPGESYKLSLTPSLISHVFTRSRPGQPDEILIPAPGPLLEGTGADQGGYVQIDGNWWLPSGRSFFDQAADPSNPAATAALELATARAHFFLPRKTVDPFGNATLVDHDAYDLLVQQVVDALGNAILSVNDYRVLNPVAITDPNRNRAMAAFDALGMVVATAVMGKDTENLGDHLQGFDPDPPLAEIQAFAADPEANAAAMLGQATTRVIYDVDRFQRAGQPTFAATLLRETHVGDPGGDATKIRITVSYSDGFGREIQRKEQAEPGLAPQRQPPVSLPSGDVGPGDLVRDGQGQIVQADTQTRWVGSGRTVFNNKGKPVKQYEPFFSSTHLYEPERDLTETGVSPITFYDPVERIVVTLRPDHTYSKIVFDAWTEATYDANDTVAPRGAQTGDPRTDPDIAGFVREYFATQPTSWQTWYAERVGGQLGAAELDAATKAAVHADTPSVSHIDTLARVFLTAVTNRQSLAGVETETINVTRIDLDVEGNQRAIHDPDGRTVVRIDYDILGNRIHQASMEAGERWGINDVAGKPIRAWDSRLFTRRMTYDVLRRLLGLFVTENGAERLAQQTVYGEAQGDATNHRTRVFQVFDGAGVATHVSYDFKGNLLETREELADEYRLAIDWQSPPPITGGSFTSQTTYDALNRTVTATSPDGSIYRPTFNEANLLEAVDVNLRGAATATPFVGNIDYDAKGQRVRIDYANGASTSYNYDPVTFRLVRLLSTRPATADSTASQLFNDSSVVQDLRYTYDPAGNATQVTDAALLVTFNNNQQIDPTGRYTYDSLYRLIEAQGREHIAQVAFDFAPADNNNRDQPFAGLRAGINDLQALRNYTERYQYDQVGNFAQIRHIANGGSWTRQYSYQEASLIEPALNNNRLSGTTVGNGVTHAESYTYDAHGNTISMPHLASMVWDFEDQLHQANLGGGGNAFYVYEAGGLRSRKVIESQNGVRSKERVYVGGFERYREFGGDGTTITLERESLHVMDDKRRIALVETLTVQGGTAIGTPAPVQRYQLGNHLGSGCVELDTVGALISYEEYHPYGTTAFQAGRSAAEVSLKRYRYTSMERDEETGLAYHSARYYIPWLGRWLSTDPIGIKDTLNLYQYVSGNPITTVDLNGLSGWKRFLGGVKAVGGAFETAAGAALVAAGAATVEIGIGIPIAAAGVLVTAHGADTVVSGVRTAVKGEDVDTFTSQGLQAAGMSRTAANLTDAGIGIAGSFGSSALTRAPAAAAAAGDAAPVLARASEAAPAVVEAAPQVAKAAPAAAEAAPQIARAAPKLAEGAEAAAPAARAAAAAAPKAAAGVDAASAAPNAVKAAAAAAPKAAGGAAAAPQAAAAGGRVAGAAAGAGRGIWSLDKFTRGRDAEKIVGNILGGKLLKATNFPTIDRAVTDAANIASEINSIKSLDLTAKSYQAAGSVLSRLTSYVSSLKGFTTATRLGQTVEANASTIRTLELALEPGVATAAQLGEIAKATAEAAKVNITLVVHYIR